MGDFRAILPHMVSPDITFSSYRDDKMNTNESCAVEVKERLSRLDDNSETAAGSHSPVEGSYQKKYICTHDDEVTFSAEHVCSVEISF